MRILSYLLILFCADSSFAQWELVHDFGQPNMYVRSIYFLHEQGAPHVGFAGVTEKSTSRGFLFRTSDAGTSWNEVGQFDRYINNICFKDKDTGWFASCDGGYNGGCYETFDGGLNWHLMPGSEGGRFALVYLPQNDLLAVSSWHQPSIITTNRGLSWAPMVGCRNGFAFLDASRGIVGQVGGGGCTDQPIYFTLDGGKTWTASENSENEECWQPVAIPSENLYLTINEPDQGDIYASTDLGRTWQRRGDLGETVLLTGQLSYDGCLLYAQSYSLGISVSSDLGYSWYPLGGPGAEADTRFFLYKDTLYAADINARLWVNHHKAFPANRLAISVKETSDYLSTFTLSLPSPWPSRGENSVPVDTTAFVVEFNHDELSLVEERPSLNRLIKDKRVLSPERTQYSVYRRNRFAASDTSIMEFTFRANVTAGGKGGYVKIGEVRFDSLSPVVTCMALTAPVDSIYIGSANCVDSILSDFLTRSDKAIAIKSINPNPALKSVTIEYESKLSDAVRVEVYNVSGVLMHEEVAAQSSVHKPLQLDTSTWPSGAYTVVLRSGEAEARGSIIKN